MFFYDALPIQRKGESAEAWRSRHETKQAHLERLALTDRFYVFEGDIRRKGEELKDRPEQKKVDIAIAVDMLSHAFRRTMDEATLLTGDLDFRPLLDALAAEGMPTTLIHPKHATVELKRSALIRVELTWGMLWQLVDGSARRPQTMMGPSFPSDFTYRLTTESGAVAQIHYKDGIHILSFETAAPPNVKIVTAHHSDKSLLLKFAEDEFGFVAPHDFVS
ncbi:MAG TPA: NYN domain-containing protein [Rhizomicrobium sp.]|nr:NYN domain-containing protein [Rhizomicrobium sp.]